MWNVSTTDDFDEWFAVLNDKEKQEVRATVQVLRMIGPTLGRPHAEHLKGSKHANLKELRVTAGAMVIRIAFAFDAKRTAVLLTAADKHGISEKRFYRGLIHKADRLYEQHL